jgi:hypothetical protein
LIDDADSGNRPSAGHRKRKAAAAAVKVEGALVKMVPQDATVVSLLD